jgi:O-antigen/teichoic acid export membrane protein
MCITSLASISLRNIDAVFIGSYKGLSDVAVYTIAITICSMIDVPGNALAKIVIPKISEAFKNKDYEFIKKVYYKSNRVTVIAGSFLFLILFVNSDALLSLLPIKYQEGNWVVKIIALGGLINMATGLNINIIQYSPHYFIGSIAFIALALLSALSNLILIPAYGLEGAALSTAFSIIVVNVFTVLFIHKKYGMQPIRAIDIGILFSALCLAFADHFFPIINNPFLSITLKTSLVIILFAIPVYKLNLIPELKELIRNKKLK